MKEDICPECQKGRIYSRKDGRFTIRVCYACGYYGSDSEAYSTYPQLVGKLFKEYFPSKVRWRVSDEFRHLAESAEEWTKPVARLCCIHSGLTRKILSVANVGMLAESV